MDKLKMQSINYIENNIEKIGKLFPNVITEKKDEDGKLKKCIDFEKLKLEFSDDINNDEESYDFTWVGKKKCIVEANTPIKKTLRPCFKESKNWEDTENLYIEGDNLDVLKLLQESYLNSIKMIYIDPPYNTGNDFIYKDNFAKDKDDYDEQIGLYDESENRLFQNNESNGRFHSDWCSMLYPRVKLASNLLSEDGVMFISIDDNEIDNLKKICNEVLGETNFIAQLPTIMNLKGNNDQFGFSGTHEYTLVYAKSYKDCVLNEFVLEDEENEEWLEDDYGFYKKGANLKATGINAPREKRPNLFFPIYVIDETLVGLSDTSEKYKLEWSLEKFDDKCQEIFPITNGEEMSWRWSKSKFLNEKYNVIVTSYGKDGVSIYKKQRPSIGDLPSKKPKSLFYKPEYSSGNGTAELKLLFNQKVFTFPKPVNLLKDLLQIGTISDSLILDFFSGSATTAHAVMKLNSEDGGNRKFIMVNLSEPCDENSEAYKAGYKNICEIGKERIRRAGNKINEEILKNNKQLKLGEEEKKPVDIGFRVLKTDSTNMKDVYYSANEYNQKMLEGLESNIKENRTDLDLLYGVLLDWGLPLSLNHKIEKVDNIEIHIVDEEALIACFAEKVSEKVIIEIAKRQPIRAVFKDSSFASSPEKINVKEIFKRLAPKTTIKVI